MANLIADEAQVQACDEINRMLDEIRLLNRRISSSEPYEIAADRKNAISVDIGLSGKITAVLKTQRTARIKAVTAKAAKFRIALDEAEQELLSDSAIRACAESA